MARKPRVFDPDGIYHLYNRGNNKAVIFPDDHAYHKFVGLLDEMIERYSIDLFSFVLMPNHIHLLLRPNDASLSRQTHFLFKRYADYFCSRYSHKGHVWESRYKFKHVDSEVYLYNISKYIEDNPVRAGLVKHVESWRYSSARLRQ